MFKADCCPACGNEVLSPYGQDEVACSGCGQEFVMHAQHAFFLYYPEFPIGY